MSSMPQRAALHSDDCQGSLHVEVSVLAFLVFLSSAEVGHG